MDRSILTIAAVLFGLGTTAMAADRLSQETVSRLSSPDRQAVLEEGARTEGKLVWYTTLNEEIIAKPVSEAFEKKYPGIKVEYVRGTSAQVIQRAQTEARMKGVTVDVMAAGSTDSLSGTGLLQPYESPVLAKFPPDRIDPKREWVSNWIGFNGIGWSTKLVRPEEVPKTWQDLANLDPKFKGKILWGSSPSNGGPRVITHLRQIWGDDQTEAYLKKLSQLDIRASTSGDYQMQEQLALGEYAFVIGTPAYIAARSIEAGAPIGVKLLDPAITRPSSIGLLKNAPHPYAAVLFMDFLLGEDGQNLFATAGMIPARPDIEPLAAIRIGVPRYAGVSEASLDGRKEAEMTPRSVDLFKQYFRGQ